jgi:hypothetical protein
MITSTLQSAITTTHLAIGEKEHGSFLQVRERIYSIQRIETSRSPQNLLAIRPNKDLGMSATLIWAPYLQIGLLI